MARDHKCNKSHLLGVRRVTKVEPPMSNSRKFDSTPVVVVNYCGMPECRLNTGDTTTTRVGLTGRWVKYRPLK